MIEKLFRPSRDTEKAIEEIVKKLNEIIESVNQSPVNSVDQRAGLPGDIRVITRNGTARIAVRTKEGWFETIDLQKGS